MTDRWLSLESICEDQSTQILLEEVEQRLQRWLINRAAASDALHRFFPGNKALDNRPSSHQTNSGQGPPQPDRAPQDAIASLLSEGLGRIDVEILDSKTMHGLRGAYVAAANSPAGTDRIFLNQAWIDSSNPNAIEEVLLEEIGHAIDYRINGNNDTIGDEGALFSAYILNKDVDSIEQFQVDQRSLDWNGTRINIEASSLTTPTHVSNIKDGVGGFDRLAGAHGISTISIDGVLYALVASKNDSAVQIINFSDPTSPTTVGSIVNGAADSNGDAFQNLAGPKEIDTVTIGARHYALVVGNGLEIIDITNPLDPLHVKSINRNDLDANGKKYTRLLGTNAVDIHTYNGKTYAAISAFDSNGYCLINISNPDEPLLVSQSQTGTGSNSVLIREINDSLYLFTSAGTSDTLMIFDITDESNVTEVVSVEQADVDSQGTPFYIDKLRKIQFFYKSGKAYIGAPSNTRYSILDVSDPTAPLQISTISPNLLTGARASTVHTLNGSTYALVTSSSQDRIQTIDVTTPAAPTAEGFISNGGNDANGYTLADFENPQGIETVVIGETMYALIAAFDSNAVQTFNLGTVRPEIAITSDKASLKIGEVATIEFTISSDVDDFDVNDVSQTGGSLSNWTRKFGGIYTATFTPTDDSNTDGEISVASNKFSSFDVFNNDGGDENNSVTLSVDTLRPTIAITDDDDDNSLSAGDTTTLTFTLSEASTDFVEADVDVSGGSLSNWTAVSSTVYTATFTPAEDSTTDGEISVASSKFSDSAGNANTDGAEENNTLTFKVDTRPPAPSPSPSPTPSPSPAPAKTPSPSPTKTPDPGTSPSPAPDPAPTPTPTPKPSPTSTIQTAPPGITLQQTGTTGDDGHLITTEQQDSTSFDVVLNAQPTGTVTVKLTGLDPTEGSLSKKTLTFTPKNWQTPQQVIVTGLSDGRRDGDITYTLNAKAKSGGGYSGKESSSISITNQDHNKGDLYLLLDTSTSMRRRGGKAHRKFQSLLALDAFTKEAERAGYQFQHRNGKNTITASRLIRKLTQQSSNRAIKLLNKHTIIDNPLDGKLADDLDIHLITYNYHVQHKNFTLSHAKPRQGIRTMQAILSLKMAGEGFGNSIKKNAQWKALRLPKPNRYDLYQGRTDRPSNLYAGTELLGALEGLDHLLTSKAKDPKRRDQSTAIALILDGRPERRSWWDTRTNSASDSIIGQAIPLPKSLGKEDITTSGLLYDNKANPHFFKNNKGQWQWKEMQNDLNAALDRLAKRSTDPATTIQANAYGLNNSGKASLNAIYQDLFSNQSFDNSSSSWSYAHHTIQSLQDLNL